MGKRGLYSPNTSVAVTLLCTIILQFLDGLYKIMYTMECSKRFVCFLDVNIFRSYLDTSLKKFDFDMSSSELTLVIKEK